MVGTQLYIITQISTCNYMFRPCILAIVHGDPEAMPPTTVRRDLVPPRVTHSHIVQLLINPYPANVENRVSS